MLKPLFLLLFLLSGAVYGQLPLDEDEFLSRLKPAAVLPEKLLNTRTAVFHPFNMSEKELTAMQQAFQKSGIDAVAYFENDHLTAGRDVSMAMAQYLLAREITNLILVRKSQGIYTLWIFEYNRKANFAEQDQPAWTMQHASLEELLRRLYLASANSGLQKENYLINDFPETGLSINPINGKRSEFFAIDLKVDPLAIPGFGDEAKDRELEEIMKMYPYKYKITDPTLSEAELRRQGSLFVLRFVKARDKVAKGLLGYDMSKAENAIVSVTHHGDVAVLKNIPANTEVYKFYFKHIDSGNVYLGTKWDADETWQQALINQLKGFKIEFRIN